MQYIAIINQKGGVGKTTTAVNLATAFSAIRKKVLLLDLDPQGNASTGVGVYAENRNKGAYQALLNPAQAASCIQPTKIPGLFLMPASVDLVGAEIELVNMEAREYRLKKVFQSIPPDIDIVLIDCPPGLGLLSLNALVASHSLLIPLQCEYYAIEGLSQLLKTVMQVKKMFNPTLELLGIVLTLFDGRNALNQQVKEEIYQTFDKKVFQTIIPRNVKVSEAPSYGKPVVLYDMNCAGALAYIRLAGEVLKRLTAPFK